MKYYIIEKPYSDWAKSLLMFPDIICVQDIDQIPDTNNVKIIPITINNMKILKNDKRTLFWTDSNTLYNLEDKCVFVEFMLQNFPDNIPKVYYIKTDKVIHDYDYTKVDIKRKMIKKKNIGCNGKGVTIINLLRDISSHECNIVVSDYIEHKDFYVGHFFVLNGEILKQAYLKGSTKNDPNFILKASITKIGHERINNLDCDDSIFGDIFEKINYTGFACADFIISSNKIMLFAINLRTGDSLFYDRVVCKEFFNFVMSSHLLN